MRYDGSGNVDQPSDVTTQNTFPSATSSDTDDFFQLSRPKIDKKDETWYTSRCANHCVRATTINILAHAGIAYRETMKITGHKCESSLSSNHEDSSDKQRRKHSALLQGLDATHKFYLSNIEINCFTKVLKTTRKSNKKDTLFHCGKWFIDKHDNLYYPFSGVTKKSFESMKAVIRSSFPLIASF
ncbi:unnamed protein product [Mytilus coruscus]|uniref:KCTD1_15 n=1 Tax=Mytilus coruscus TaxID=42192 RepID=A0A6J8ALA8_MYTCO|nr:unnamed protein product [Mytilus coruscus]